ncbi:MAG: hypothetical protein ABSE47_05090 [Acidimicrobiales bacterium]
MTAEAGRSAGRSATLAAAHSLPCDFPSAEAATGLVSMMLSDPGFYGVVAEIDGQVVGSNFPDERNAVGMPAAIVS